MKNKMTTLAMGMAVSVVLTACEKPIFDEEQQETEQTQDGKTLKDKEKGNVVFRVAEFRQVPFDTRSVEDLTTYCTRLNFVVYQDGKKMDSRSQLKENGNFGEVSMSLLPGTYQLLVLAHSSTGGNPTVSDPEKIQFTNALGYSDTFSYYGEIEVTKEDQTYDVTLTRDVSCLRFTVKDEFPEGVTFMKFYYTGGSGVLNAITGKGALVNSQQEKLVRVTGLETPLTFNLYTFLQDEEAKLQVTVTALAEDKSTSLFERKFENVPMKHCMVTEYAGILFDHSSSNSFTLKAETDWGTPYYHYDF
jgi:hypothetical protein